MFSENKAVWLVEGIWRSLNSDQWYTTSLLFFSEHCKITIRHETVPVRIKNSHCGIKKRCIFKLNKDNCKLNLLEKRLYFCSLIKVTWHLMGDALWLFNATFNNITVISWWLVLLIEETRMSGENHETTKLGKLLDKTTKL